ncbi:MAG: hypothetical protein ACYC1Y_00695 [Minisyncoccota bacterium]
MRISYMRSPERFSNAESPKEDEVQYEGDPTLRARELAREDGFDHALHSLQEQGLLEGEVTRVKALYEERLSGEQPFMTEEVWTAFTIMELFHPETAEHCAETYRLARDKVERHLLGSGVLLADLFAEEKVTLPIFYRACLLHDVGKVDIPYEVISNTVSDQECACLLTLNQDDTLVHNAFAEHHILPTDDPDALIRDLATMGRRPMNIAPAEMLLAPETIEKLVKRGVDVSQTLAELIRPHEAHSASILEVLGFPEESKLAARHHNYQNLPIETPIAIGSLGVSVDLAEILHLADVEQAMVAHRGYKLSATNLEAMVTLVRHVEHGIINSEVVALWVRDEIENLFQNKELFAEIAADPDERARLATVAAFLKKHDSVRFGDQTIQISPPSFDLAPA